MPRGAKTIDNCAGHRTKKKKKPVRKLKRLCSQGRDASSVTV